MGEVWSRFWAMIKPGGVALLIVLALSLLLLQHGGGAGQTTLERRTQKAMEQIEGAGRVQMVIRTRRTQGSSALSGGEEIPCGAFAVAQGADDPIVRMQLEQALCALLGLPASAVEIVAGGGTNGI